MSKNQSNQPNQYILLPITRQEVDDLIASLDLTINELECQMVETAHNPSPDVREGRIETDSVLTGFMLLREKLQSSLSTNINPTLNKALNPNSKSRRHG